LISENELERIDGKLAICFKLQTADEPGDEERKSSVNENMILNKYFSCNLKPALTRQNLPECLKPREFSKQIIEFGQSTQPESHGLAGLLWPKSSAQNINVKVAKSQG